MGKYGCGPFKIHKKKVFALSRVITKVFLLCDTNASKMGKNFVSSAERKSCKCQLKCQLNRVSPAGLDIGYVPAGPAAFFRWSGQFGPQQLIFYWPAVFFILFIIIIFFYIYILFFLFFFRITIHI